MERWDRGGGGEGWPKKGLDRGFIGEEERQRRRKKCVHRLSASWGLIERYIFFRVIFIIIINSFYATSCASGDCPHPVLFSFLIVISFPLFLPSLLLVSPYGGYYSFSRNLSLRYSSKWLWRTTDDETAKCWRQGETKRSSQN